jgi:hypothetical protein
MRVMVEIGLVVGYLTAWVLRKAKRASGRLDAEVDAVMDAGLDRVHELVAGRLGTEPALVRLEVEAAESGEVSQRTRQRVELALVDEVERDEQFARALAGALGRLAGAGGPSAVEIDLRDARGVQVGHQNTQTNTFN